MLFLLFKQETEKAIIRNGIFKILCCEYHMFLGYRPGEIVSKFSSLLNFFQYFLVNFMYYACYAVFLGLAILTILFVLNKMLFFTILFFFCAHIINIIAFKGRIFRASDSYYRCKSRLSSAITDFSEGYIQIRMSGLNQGLLGKMHKVILRQYSFLFKKNIYSLLQGGIQNTLVVLNSISFIMILSNEKFGSKSSLGELMFYILLLRFLYEPIYRFNSINSLLQNAVALLQQIYQYSNHPKIEQIHEHIDELEENIENIAFESVSFKYPNENKAILKNASVRFEKNNIYLIKGESGIGKTTIFYLLSKLYLCQEGNIFVNGKSIDRINVANLREKLSVSPQCSHLFAGTILDNVSFFNSNVDYDLFQECISSTGSSDFISNQGDEIITESSINFSTGQMQRICNIRTLYDSGHSDVILLDEPTAHLDEKHEKQFLDSLKKYKKDKIIILISHRDKFKEYCDKILTITKGQIVSDVNIANNGVTNR